MKKAVAIVALGLSLTSSAAMAAERTTDTALGAVSGAVVLGPIGAVAGALVGYTAGPSISHSWAPRRLRKARQARTSTLRDARAPVNDHQSAPDAQANAPAPTQAPPAPKSASTAPPVQTLE
jgi:hypothetical protein